MVLLQPKIAAACVMRSNPSFPTPFRLCLCGNSSLWCSSGRPACWVVIVAHYMTVHHAPAGWLGGAAAAERSSRLCDVV
jgi:hypothetical protein